MQNIQLFRERQRQWALSNYIYINPRFVLRSIQ